MYLTTSHNLKKNDQPTNQRKKHTHKKPQNQKTKLHFHDFNKNYFLSFKMQIFVKEKNIWAEKM